MCSSCCEEMINFGCRNTKCFWLIDNESFPADDERKGNPSVCFHPTEIGFPSFYPAFSKRNPSAKTATVSHSHPCLGPFHPFSRSCPLKLIQLAIHNLQAFWHTELPLCTLRPRDGQPHPLDGHPALLRKERLNFPAFALLWLVLVSNFFPPTV